MKRILSAITLIFVLVTALAACSSSDNSNGYSGNGDLTYGQIEDIKTTKTSYFDFVVNGNTATVKKFKADGDYPTSIRIPAEYDGVKVTSISADCFAECDKLVNIVLPSTITTIGDRAFYNCKALKAVVLTESVRSFGEATFYGCSSLEYIKLPKSLKKMGTGTFSACLNLKRIFVYKNSYAYTQLSAGGFGMELQILDD